MSQCLKFNYLMRIVLGAEVVVKEGKGHKLCYDWYSRLL